MAALAASVPAFDFTLAGIGRFPEVVYLAPTPAEHLVRLTKYLVEALPGCLPYGGGHDVATPHVTMLRSPDPVLLDEAATALARTLPIECRAEALWLMEETGAAGRRLRAAFPLQR